MAEYSYIARNLSGERVTGSIAAATRREALTAITARSLFPIEVRGDKAAVAGKSVGRISAQGRAAVYGQMADLLRSGVPLLRSIEVLQRQATHRATKEVLNQIHRHVEEGESLADAMRRFPAVFEEIAVSMVRAGGEGGFLEEALARLAQFTEAQDDLKKRVVGAMAYPVFLSIVGSLIITALMIFFVPNFEPLFEDLKAQGKMPLMTIWVLGSSSFLQHYGLVLAGLAVAGIVALRQWIKTDGGCRWKDLIKIHIPLAGKVFLSLAVARFCRVLGTLLHNGVPILRGLEISSDAAGNRVLAEAIRDATENISAGQRLSGPMGACGHFPPTVVEMISVAEESNTLESVLLGIADSLERRTWRQLDLVVRLLEPIMLMLLAGVVLILVVGLLLPIIKIGTTI